MKKLNKKYFHELEKMKLKKDIDVEIIDNKLQIVKIREKIVKDQVSFFNNPSEFLKSVLGNKMMQLSDRHVQLHEKTKKSIKILPRNDRLMHAAEKIRTTPNQSFDDSFKQRFLVTISEMDIGDTRIINSVAVLKTKTGILMSPGDKYCAFKMAMFLRRLFSNRNWQVQKMFATAGELAAISLMSYFDTYEIIETYLVRTGETQYHIATFLAQKDLNKMMQTVQQSKQISTLRDKQSYFNNQKEQNNAIVKKNNEKIRERINMTAYNKAAVIVKLAKYANNLQMIPKIECQHNMSMIDRKQTNVNVVAQLLYDPSTSEEGYYNLAQEVNRWDTNLCHSCLNDFVMRYGGIKSVKKKLKKKTFTHETVQVKVKMTKLNTDSVYIGYLPPILRPSGVIGRFFKKQLATLYQGMHTTEETYNLITKGKMQGSSPHGGSRTVANVIQHKSFSSEPNTLIVDVQSKHTGVAKHLVGQKFQMIKNLQTGNMEEVKRVITQPTLCTRQIITIADYNFATQNTPGKVLDRMINVDGHDVKQFSKLFIKNDLQTCDIEKLVSKCQAKEFNFQLLQQQVQETLIDLAREGVQIDKVRFVFNDMYWYLKRDATKWNTLFDVIRGLQINYPNGPNDNRMQRSRKVSVNVAGMQYPNYDHVNFLADDEGTVFIDQGILQHHAKGAGDPYIHLNSQLDMACSHSVDMNEANHGCAIQYKFWHGIKIAFKETLISVSGPQVPQLDNVEADYFSRQKIKVYGKGLAARLQNNFPRIQNSIAEKYLACRHNDSLYDREIQIVNQTEEYLSSFYQTNEYIVKWILSWVSILSAFQTISHVIVYMTICTSYVILVLTIQFYVYVLVIVITLIIFMYRKRMSQVIKVVVLSTIIILMIQMSPIDWITNCVWIVLLIQWLCDRNGFCTTWMKWLRLTIKKKKVLNPRELIQIGAIVAKPLKEVKKINTTNRTFKSIKCTYKKMPVSWDQFCRLGKIADVENLKDLQVNYQQSGPDVYVDGEKRNVLTYCHKDVVTAAHATANRLFSANTQIDIDMLNQLELVTSRVLVKKFLEYDLQDLPNPWDRIKQKETWSKKKIQDCLDLMEEACQKNSFRYLKSKYGAFIKSFEENAQGAKVILKEHGTDKIYRQDEKDDGHIEVVDAHNDCNRARWVQNKPEGAGGWCIVLANDLNEIAGMKVKGYSYRTNEAMILNFAKKHVDMFDQVFGISTDFSSMDATVGYELRNRTEYVIIRALRQKLTARYMSYGAQKEWIDQAFEALLQKDFTCQYRQGDFAMDIKLDQRMSGIPTTTFGNTIITVALFYTIAYRTNLKRLIDRKNEFHYLISPKTLRLQALGLKHSDIDLITEYNWVLKCSGDDHVSLFSTRKDRTDFLEQMLLTTARGKQDRTPCTGLIVPEKDLVISEDRFVFCSKVIQIINQKVTVIPLIENVIFNSRYYSGHNTKMIQNNREHRLAVATAKTYTLQNSEHLKFISDMWLKTTEKTTLQHKIGEWIKRFGNFWNSKRELNMTSINDVDVAIEKEMLNLGYDLAKTVEANEQNLQNGEDRLDLIRIKIGQLSDWSQEKQKMVKYKYQRAPYKKIQKMLLDDGVPLQQIPGDDRADVAVGLINLKTVQPSQNQSIYYNDKVLRFNFNDIFIPGYQASTSNDNDTFSTNYSIQTGLSGTHVEKWRVRSFTVECFETEPSLTQKGRLYTIITNVGNLSPLEIKNHQMTVSHDAGKQVRIQMIPDSFNDQLFINSVSDTTVMNKYVYFHYEGHSQQSLIGINLSIKYEYLINENVKHIVVPAKTVDGTVQQAQESLEAVSRIVDATNSKSNVDASKDDATAETLDEKFRRLTLEGRSYMRLLPVLLKAVNALSDIMPGRKKWKHKKHGGKQIGGLRYIGDGAYISDGKSPLQEAVHELGEIRLITKDHVIFQDLKRLLAQMSFRGKQLYMDSIVEQGDYKIFKANTYEPEDKKERIFSLDDYLTDQKNKKSSKKV